MVHSWKEANMPILPRKSRSQKNVPDSMGKATYDVWATVRLAALVSLLAADNTSACSGYKLDTRVRITF